jgi:MYXO-CTERM domain-containing protein
MARAPEYADGLRRLGALAICLAGLLHAGAARADGAFPGSSGLMAPATRPNDIILGTNFGVVSSIDDGQTWTWSCEVPQTSFGFQYQLGAPPMLRLYALTASGLVYSDDRACSWSVSGGMLTDDTVSDAFPDPTSPNRVLAIATAVTDGGSGPTRVLESADGGKTFTSVLYTAATGDSLTGIEIARSAPATVYMTIFSNTAAPRLGRSTDDGAHWTIHDLGAVLGAGTRSARLLAVDPTNADRVYLRVGATAGDGAMAGDRLAVSDDGGASARFSLDLKDGVLTAFTRTPAGDLVVVGVQSVTPVAYKSTDSGSSFQQLPTPPNLVGLAARGTVLYGATDTTKETEALVVSGDDGMTWQPLMQFADIQAIDTCAKARCQADCQMRADMDQWPLDMCDATPAPKPVDAGTPGGGSDAAGAGGSGVSGAGGSGPAPDARAPDAGADAPASKPSSSGCGCAAAAGAPVPAGAIALGALAAALLRRRRGRRGRARSEGSKAAP